MAPYPSRARPGNARPRSTSSRAKAAKSARWAMDAPYRTSATGSLRALSADAASRATTGTVHGRSAGVVCGTGRGVIRISSGESSGADRRRQQQDRSTGLARMDPSDHVGGCGERMLSSCAQRLARTFHREIRILGPQAQAVRGRPEAVQDQHWRSLFRGAGARLTSVGSGVTQRCPRLLQALNLVLAAAKRRTAGSQRLGRACAWPRRGWARRATYGRLCNA